MREIYSQAERVVAWMGDSVESTGALSYAANLHATSTSGTESEMIDAWEMRRPIGGEHDPRWTSIQALLNQEWFERVWVIQEVALAEKLVVRHGAGEEIPWETLAEFGEFLFMPEVEPRLQDPTKGIDKTLYRRIYNLKTLKMLRESRDELQSPADGFDLGTILSIARNFKASKPHDKIYGLLALTPLKTRTKIKADYELPLRDLILSITRYAFQLDESAESAHLPGLCFAGIVNRNQCSPHIRNLELPSWSPDWMSDPQENPVVNGMLCKTATHSDLLPLIRPVEDTPGHLRIQAAQFGTILRSGPVMTILENITDQREAMIQFFDFVNQCSQLCIQAIHKQGLFKGPFQTPLDLFWRTALMDRLQTGESPIPADALEEFKTTAMMMQLSVAGATPATLQHHTMGHVSMLDLAARKLFMLIGSTVAGKKMCLTNNGYMAIQY